MDKLEFEITPEEVIYDETFEELTNGRGEEEDE